MVDLEQLKADREAGTEGGWVASKYLGNKDGWFVRSQGQESICGKGSIELSEANARRIARLPDLEAAYIEVVAKLDKAVKALEPFADCMKYIGDNYEDEEYPDDWSPFIQVKHYKNAEATIKLLILKTK